MKIKTNCEHCKSEFWKENSQIKEGKSNFCSRSCSAKENNKKSPKRSPEGECSTCKSPIPKCLKRCDDCRTKTREMKYATCKCGYEKLRNSKLCSKCRRIDSGDKTKADFEYSENGNRCSQYARIRDNSRYIAKTKGLYQKGCHFCGYSKFLEIAHIKAVKDFDDNALISEINHTNNLVQVCRNCHWELDHGQLMMDK